MNESNLHPTIQEFKKFVNQHPKLLKEIRKSGRSWQEYYEKWVLLGDDDPYWSTFSEGSSDDSTKEDSKSNKANMDNEDEDGSNKKTEIFTKLREMTDNFDVDKVQNQVHQLSGAITSLQELLGQFQTKGTKDSGQKFGMFKD